MQHTHTHTHIKNTPSDCEEYSCLQIYFLTFHYFQKTKTRKKIIEIHTCTNATGQNNQDASSESIQKFHRKPSFYRKFHQVLDYQYFDDGC